MDILSKVFERHFQKAVKTWPGVYQNLQRVEERRRHKHVKHICTFCGKSHASALRTCALCKSVRYCDRNCQTADYRSGHKEECINFADPPLTAAFLTEPAGDTSYPSEPIFARAHANGVGFWVSISGTICCGMGSFATCMRGLMESQEVKAFYYAADPDLKVHERNLLTLQVLVQNRRKDKRPALVYGSHTRVTSYPTSYQSVMNGKVQGDNATTWLLRRGETNLPCAAVGVASDLRSKKPRLFVKNFNGDDMPKDAPLPPAVLDSDKGIVVLNPGDFVILQMQFRVGDGTPNMSKDFHVLFDLHSLYVPISIPNATTSGSGTDTSSSAQEMRDLMRAFGASLALHTQTDAEPYGIRARFDRDIMMQYYRDYIEHGEIAHVQSHYGEEKVRALVMQSRAVKETMSEFESRRGSLEAAMDELRSLGLDGYARRFEQVWQTALKG